MLFNTNPWFFRLNFDGMRIRSTLSQNRIKVILVSLLLLFYPNFHVWDDLDNLRSSKICQREFFFSIDLGVVWSTKDSLDTKQSATVFWTGGPQILKMHPQCCGIPKIVKFLGRWAKMSSILGFLNQGIRAYTEQVMDGLLRPAQIWTVRDNA